MKISNVSMITADEVEIKLNSVLYDFSYEHGYGFNGKTEIKVRAHRVISVNEAARHFRTRCEKGCETEHSLSKGCSRNKLYGSIESVRKEIRARMQQDLKACTQKIDKVNNTKRSIDNAWTLIKDLKKSDIKEPKAVRVS